MQGRQHTNHIMVRENCGFGYEGRGFWNRFKWGTRFGSKSLWKLKAKALVENKEGIYEIIIYENGKMNLLRQLLDIPKNKQNKIKPINIRSHEFKVSLLAWLFFFSHIQEKRAEELESLDLRIAN